MMKSKDQVLQGEMSEAEIDNNLMQTFPASDPPSWTLGTDHREESQSETEVKESPAGETSPTG